MRKIELDIFMNKLYQDYEVVLKCGSNYSVLRSFQGESAKDDAENELDRIKKELGL